MEHKNEVQCNNDPLFPSLFLYFGQDARARETMSNGEEEVEGGKEAREELFSLKMQISETSFPSTSISFNYLISCRLEKEKNFTL